MTDFNWKQGENESDVAYWLRCYEYEMGVARGIAQPANLREVAEMPESMFLFREKGTWTMPELAESYEDWGDEDKWKLKHSLKLLSGLPPDTKVLVHQFLSGNGGVIFLYAYQNLDDVMTFLMADHSTANEDSLYGDDPVRKPGDHHPSEPHDPKDVFPPTKEEYIAQIRQKLETNGYADQPAWHEWHVCVLTAGEYVAIVKAELAKV